MTSTPPEQAPTIGLDEEQAHELRTTMLIARRAAGIDRFRLALLATVLAVGLTLGLGMFERWQFAERLPLNNPRASLPSPLYEATWYEPPRTLEQILLSLKDMRGG